MALKKHDRVTVKVRDDPPFSGIITGESRDRHGWQIIKDGTKWPRGIHKTFCFPEVILPTVPLTWPDGQPVLPAHPVSLLIVGDQDDRNTSHSSLIE